LGYTINQWDVPNGSVPYLAVFKIVQPALRECAVVGYFHFIIKYLSFSIIIGLVMGFTLECIVVNHLSSPDLGCFNVYHSKMSFTLPLHTTNDHH
jgi:hypothetical protein